MPVDGCSWDKMKTSGTEPPSGKAGPGLETPLHFSWAPVLFLSREVPDSVQIRALACQQPPSLLNPPRPLPSCLPPPLSSFFGDSDNNSHHTLYLQFTRPIRSMGLGLTLFFTTEAMTFALRDWERSPVPTTEPSFPWNHLFSFKKKFNFHLAFSSIPIDAS